MDLRDIRLIGAVVIGIPLLIWQVWADWLAEDAIAREIEVTASIRTGKGVAERVPILAKYEENQKDTSRTYRGNSSFWQEMDVAANSLSETEMKHLRELIVATIETFNSLRQNKVICVRNIRTNINPYDNYMSPSERNLTRWVTNYIEDNPSAADNPDGTAVIRLAFTGKMPRSKN